MWCVISRHTGAECRAPTPHAGQGHNGAAAGAGQARGPDRGHERHPQPVRQPIRPQGAGTSCVCRVLLRSQMVRSRATWAYECDCLMQGLDCGLAPCLAWPHDLPPVTAGYRQQPTASHHQKPCYVRGPDIDSVRMSRWRRTTRAFSWCRSSSRSTASGSCRPTCTTSRFAAFVSAIAVRKRMG